MKSLKDVEIKKDDKVFVASDIDVPIINGSPAEPFRLDQIIPSLKYIIDKRAIPVIAGHIGQPEGKIDTNLSTQHLTQYFDNKLGPGKYILLENLRFDPGEEANDIEFARKISLDCSIYVNENFSTSHRKHASIVGVPGLIPGYAGFRFEAEIETLSNLLNEVSRPFTVIIGGAKIESKKPVIETFLKKADTVLLGGKLAMEWVEPVPQNLVLPRDYTSENKDIGTETIHAFTKLIMSSKTILWAGPMGMYENEEYIAGSKAVAEAVAYATKNNGCVSIAGGGDTIAVLNKLGTLSDISFVSSGGGAMLAFLSKGTLPALEFLS